MIRQVLVYFYVDTYVVTETIKVFCEKFCPISTKKQIVKSVSKVTKLLQTFWCPPYWLILQRKSSIICQANWSQYEGDLSAIQVHKPVQNIFQSSDTKIT